MCSSSDELKCVHLREFETECVLIPTPLCKNHYYVVYNALQSPKKHCITCGRCLRLGNDRPCPQPHVIQMHLSLDTDFEGDILADDHVCLTCYKSHSVILKGNQPISTDEDLKELVDTLGQQATIITSMSNAEDIICVVTNRMLTTVGTMLTEILSDFKQ